MKSINLSTKKNTQFIIIILCGKLWVIEEKYSIHVIVTNIYIFWYSDNRILLRKTIMIEYV